MGRSRGSLSSRSADFAGPSASGAFQERSRGIVSSTVRRCPPVIGPPFPELRQIPPDVLDYLFDLPVEETLDYRRPRTASFGSCRYRLVSFGPAYAT